MNGVYTPNTDRCGREHMIVGFTTVCAISVHHQ